MNKNIIDFLPIVAIFLILLLTWFLPNCSLYDYIKGTRSFEESQNESVLIVCKECNGTGQTKQDINLLMSQASFAIWQNIHINSHKCEVCSEDKLCSISQKKYDEIMDTYKKLGPKNEIADCPNCMGMGSYKQYNGYRFGKEKNE